MRIKSAVSTLFRDALLQKASTFPNPFIAAPPLAIVSESHPEDQRSPGVLAASDVASQPQTAPAPSLPVHRSAMPHSARPRDKTT